MSETKIEMQLCDLLAQVRTYSLEREHLLKEEAERRGIQLLLNEPDVSAEHRDAVRLYGLREISRSELYWGRTPAGDILDHFIQRAERLIASNEAERLGMTPAEFATTPSVWVFCRQETIKIFKEPLRESQLDDFLSGVALNAITEPSRASIALAILHDKGFTAKLLDALWANYPYDAKAMKLLRPAAHDAKTKGAAPKAGTPFPAVEELTPDQAGHTEPCTADEAIKLIKSPWATYDQIASVYGLSPSALRSKVKRDRDKKDPTQRIILAQDVRPLVDGGLRNPKKQFRVVAVHKLLQSKRSEIPAERLQEKQE